MAERPVPEPFVARVPSLSVEELRRIVGSPRAYRRAVVEAAAAELALRGEPLSAAERAGLEGELAHEARRDFSFSRALVLLLGGSHAARRARIRLVALALLAAGWGAAAWVALNAPPDAPHPFGVAPEETGKYQREVERIGGTASVLAGQLQRWVEGLFRGRALALTLACATTLAAALFWRACTRANDALAEADADPDAARE